MKNEISQKIINVIITIVFITLVGSSIYFNYFNWEIRKIEISKSSTLNFLKVDNQSINEKKDYYNSDNYKERLFKSENLKNKDEIIIRTESSETYINNTDTPYIVKSEPKTSNINKWINCILIGGFQENSSNYCK